MYELITPPSVEPFTLTDLKEALRIDHSAEDDLVMRLGITARRVVERRLSRAVAEQTWRLTRPQPDNRPLLLRPGPVTNVLTVEVQYGDGQYELHPDHRFIQSEPARLDLTAPDRKEGLELTAVRITYTAGLSDVSRTQSDILQAIYLLAAHYYENRQAVEQGRYVAIPSGVESLLDALREVQL